MTINEVARRLVELCNTDRAEQAVTELYSENIVSIEGADMPQMPARLEGLEALAAKGSWWEENHEVHETRVDGPYIGLRDDQFIARFEIDATFKPTGKRTSMRECALYTVKDGKIVQEEFLYLADPEDS